MYLILGIVILVVLILVIRLFGAWMLRIDEIIKHQKIVIQELRKLNNTKEANQISSGTNNIEKVSNQ